MVEFDYNDNLARSCVAVVSLAVCMYACMCVYRYACNAITFESTDVESSFLFCGYCLREFGSSWYYADRPVKVKVMGTKRRENIYSRNVKPKSAITPVPWKLEPRSLRAALGFSDMADQMVWPPYFSRDRIWPRLIRSGGARTSRQPGQFQVT